MQFNLHEYISYTHVTLSHETSLKLQLLVSRRDRNNSWELSWVIFYFGAELCSLGLELSSGYDISFTNGIKSLKTGLKYSDPGVKDANVI